MSFFQRLRLAITAFLLALFSRPKLVGSRAFVTRDGRRLMPGSGDLSGLTVEELAHSLARMNRLCGHTAGPLGYSFARHAVYVSKHIPDKGLALKALMYDAHKSLTGDVAAPARFALASMGGGVTLNAFEDKLRADLFKHFGIQMPTTEEIVELGTALERAHASELRDMVGVNEGNPYDDQTGPDDPRDAAAAFVSQYNELSTK